MCELFAISSGRAFDATTYLAEFFDHSHANPHGWGLAVRSGSPANGSTKRTDGPAQRADDSVQRTQRIPQPEVFPDERHGDLLRWREPVAAYASQVVPQLLSRPVKASHLLAHVRNATCATLEPENCHPFVDMDISGRLWTMIHNGILLNEGMLWGYEGRTSGQTDSERTLLFLLDVLDEAALRSGGPLDFDQTFAALTSAITQLGNLNKLNLILDDGTYTYVHTNTDETTLYFRTRADKNGTPETTVFATTPLGGPKERGEWKPVPKNRLIAYRSGRLVRASAPHGNVFCEAILEARKALVGSLWDPQADPNKASRGQVMPAPSPQPDREPQEADVA